MAKLKPKTVKKRTRSSTLAKDRSMDTAFLLIVLVLLAFGLIMVFSASYAYALNYEGDSFYYIKRQGLLRYLTLSACCLSAGLIIGSLKNSGLSSTALALHF